MAIQNISPDKLLLDVENPRFGLSKNNSQSEALQYLFETSDIKELWFSIVENGFLSYEPLVAFKPDPAIDEYIVVEGNRRLAAVKMLRDPSIIANFSKAAVPTVPDEHKLSLDALAVTVITARHDADEYIGFRHVNGSRNWEPLAKARFGMRLLEKLRQRPDATDMTDKGRIAILARQIGDQPTQITRNLFAYKVLEQAMSLHLLQENFLEKTKNDFSHLYSILSNPDTRNYIGLGYTALQAEQITDTPIPETHLKKLGHLMTWLFGSPDGEKKTIIERQGQDRPALQKVIASNSGLLYLEETGDFKAAQNMAGINVDDWINAVFELDIRVKKVWDASLDVTDTLSKEDKDKAILALTNSANRIAKLLPTLKE